MTEAPKKRGRPAKAAVAPAKAPSVASKGKLRCNVANAIFDGNGGFLAVGETFDAPNGDDLIAKGLAE
jgi:AT hook motif